MCKIRFQSKGRKQFTQISNRFIDEYMADANGSYVKIYIYLLRCISEAVYNTQDSLDFAISAMADRLEYTEKDIVRALRYWTKKGVLEFEQNEAGSISSIALFDLTEDATEEVAAAKEVPEPAKPIKRASEPTAKTVAAPPVNTEEDSSESIFARVEQILGQPLSPTHTQVVLHCIEFLQFPADLIAFLYEYCKASKKTSGKYVQQVAINWHSEGITTLAAAESRVKFFRESILVAMKQLGLSGTPGEALLTYVETWEKTYRMSPELIEEACRRAYCSVKSNHLPYTDKILKRWSDAGVTNLADVSVLDREHADACKHSAKSTSSDNNRFHNFSEREYSSEEMDALERKLLGL